MRKSSSTAAERNEAETLMMMSVHALFDACMILPYDEGQMNGGDRS
jgi:hypothetical protein